MRCNVPSDAVAEADVTPAPNFSAAGEDVEQKRNHRY